MSVPSMGITVVALGTSGDLPSVGAGSDRADPRFLFRCGIGKRVRHLPDA